jgi:hypothetical protein
MSMTVKINHLREKRALCNRIKDLALSNSGIIFGGMVRDDIIGKHYRNLFIKKDLDFDKYWDSSYDPETKHRLIMPNDMDVFFRADNNSTTFLNKLREFTNKFMGRVYVVDDKNFTRFDYIEDNKYLRHKIVDIELRLGETLTQRGVKIRMKIDIIEINHSCSNGNNMEFIQYVDKIEPPFYNLDFQCNVFIMERNKSNNDNIRISNCTGTPIDGMVFSEKMMYSSQIINDIINFKTKFTRSVSSPSAEYINCYRILKMLVRSTRWNITNLPFKFIATDNIKKGEIIDETCCICLEEIDDSKELAELNTNKIKKNYLHSCCFLNYLAKEQQAKYRDSETNQIECRCPFRSFFNFRDCHTNIEYI